VVIMDFGLAAIAAPQTNAGCEANPKPEAHHPPATAEPTAQPGPELP
jgi:hypothetical protein